MIIRNKIALVAHDNKKEDLLSWARFNRDMLIEHELFATGTTGKMLREELQLEITGLESGPLGGDMQIGSKITEGQIDYLVFFWDPLEPLPHDPDIKALLRVAVVWNIPIACNRSSADYIFSSPLVFNGYKRKVPNFDNYKIRKVDLTPQEQENKE
jgi:methylglyoxal synthase